MSDDRGDYQGDNLERQKALLLNLMPKLIGLLEAVGIGTIATTLYSTGLINSETFDSIGLNTTDTEKSRQVMRGVENSVKVNSKNYDEFVKVLDDISHGKEIIKLLKKECKL